jgi:CheY-like chemotaxis protein
VSDTASSAAPHLMTISSVVLLDLSMPVLDGTLNASRCCVTISDTRVCAGVSATVEIRQIESTRSKSLKPEESHPTRILALTGMSSIEDKRRAFEAGVDG